MTKGIIDIYQISGIINNGCELTPVIIM